MIFADFLLPGYGIAVMKRIHTDLDPQHSRQNNVRTVPPLPHIKSVSKNVRKLFRLALAAPHNEHVRNIYTTPSKMRIARFYEKFYTLVKQSKKLVLINLIT